MRCSRGMTWLAVGATALAAACSDPEDAAPATNASDAGGASYSMPRPDLLWPMDLSEDAVAAMSLEELWQIGVDHLNWPAEMPAGTRKADVHERLVEARFHDIEDTGYGGG